MEPVGASQILLLLLVESLLYVLLQFQYSFFPFSSTYLKQCLVSIEDAFSWCSHLHGFNLQ